MSAAPDRRPRVLSVVGARPQFIKLAPLHKALSRRGRHIIVHTGQHYDDAMSARFFSELRLPEPDIHLGVRGGGHAGPTSRMLLRLAGVLADQQPDWLIVYGDTTSTLAGALAGAQCGVPVAHVEAGLRSFVRRQPEERNRVIADHLADRLFCPTRAAVQNLRREGIRRGVFLVGDPMHDALTEQWGRARRLPLRAGSADYLFCTVHRAENTDDPGRLRALVRLLAALEQTIVLPLHPRTRRALKAHGLWRRLARIPHVELHAPFGYLDSLRHIHGARAVLTDSGGVQREACWFGTPCLTLRPVTEWVETVARGANVLVDLDIARVKRALARRPRKRPARVRAHVARTIAEHLLSG